MPLANPSVIDAIGIDTVTGEVVLSLLDEMEWTELELHATLLGEKLNHYLGFIEAGELTQAYPESDGRATRIDVIFRCDPPSVVLSSFAGAAELAAAYECSINWRVHAT